MIYGATRSHRGGRAAQRRGTMQLVDAMSLVDAIESEPKGKGEHMDQIAENDNDEEEEQQQQEQEENKEDQRVLFPKSRRRSSAESTATAASGSTVDEKILNLKIRRKTSIMMPLNIDELPPSSLFEKITR